MIIKATSKAICVYAQLVSFRTDGCGQATNSTQRPVVRRCKKREFLYYLFLYVYTKLFNFLGRAIYSCRTDPKGEGSISSTTCASRTRSTTCYMWRYTCSVQWLTSHIQSTWTAAHN